MQQTSEAFAPGSEAKAAEMAGKWWAERLEPKHADKKEAFAAAVARLVGEALRGDAYWVFGENRRAGDGVPRGHVNTESDYDPQGLLLDAVREVIDPECRGFAGSSYGILPLKHTLTITRDVLKPKEGYGNFTADIAVEA